MNLDMESVISAKLSPQRWQHSLRVAQLAQELAEIWGVNTEQAKMAGLMHDYARELSHEQLLYLAAYFGHNILEEERENPVVLHAPVGAFLLEKDFGLKDQEVLNAIIRHTVGGSSMTLLDKIIFLADMIEPGRNWPGIDILRKLTREDIDKAMIVALDQTITYIKQKKMSIHPITILARENILKAK